MTDLKTKIEEIHFKHFSTKTISKYDKSFIKELVLFIAEDAFKSGEANVDASGAILGAEESYFKYLKKELE